MKSNHEQRLKRVRISCGDWTRVVTPAICEHNPMPVAVFLDPPYGETNSAKVYTGHTGHTFTIAAKARQWALEHGDNPNYRIALCGYAGEGHEELLNHGWTTHRWSKNGGYGNNNRNGNNNHLRECIWFSPHCLPASMTLFDQLTT